MAVGPVYRQFSSMGADLPMAVTDARVVAADAPKRWLEALASLQVAAPRYCHWS